MDFSLTDEERAIRETARQFITREVMPLEQEALLRERRQQPGLEHSELRELQLKARKFGFWGLSTPEEYGGMDLPAGVQSRVWTEGGRPLRPIKFRGGGGKIPHSTNEPPKQEKPVPTHQGG